MEPKAGAKNTQWQNSWPNEGNKELVLSSLYLVQTSTIKWNNAFRSDPNPLLYLFEASLDAAVLAGHPFAVPVVCSPTGHAQIWVTLPHSQVAGTLLGVALGLTSAAWEAVLAWNKNRRNASTSITLECQKIIQRQTAQREKVGCREAASLATSAGGCVQVQLWMAQSQEESDMNNLNVLSAGGAGGRGPFKEPLSPFCCVHTQALLGSSCGSHTDVRCDVVN